MVSRKQLKDAKEELAKQYKCKPSEIKVDGSNSTLEVIVEPVQPKDFIDWDYNSRDNWRDNHPQQTIASVNLEDNCTCCGLLELDGLGDIKTGAIATLLLHYMQKNCKEALVFATTVQSQAVPRRALEEAGFVVAGTGKSNKTRNTITLLVAPLHRAA
jgi:hypothetical protein